MKNREEKKEREREKRVDQKLLRERERKLQERYEGGRSRRTERNEEKRAHLHPGGSYFPFFREGY